MVRHAQSEANVASARLGAGEVSAIWPFLTMGADAPLSDMGRQQLAAAQAQLIGFIEDRGVQLIAHSPLVRAQQTAHALFSGCGAPFVELPFVRVTPPSGEGTCHALPVLPCPALPCPALPFHLPGQPAGSFATGAQIYERTTSEWASIAGMDSRIEQLRSWLAERDETVIVIVGHGQFFKRCLNRGFVQANVSVLECSFSAHSGFLLQAELHPAAEVAARRVHEGGEGAAAGEEIASGDGGPMQAVRDRMRDMTLLPLLPPPLLDERLDGVSGLTEVADITAPAVASAVEMGTEGEAAADGQGATGAVTLAGAGAGGVAESWWGGASLRALLPSCSVST